MEILDLVTARLKIRQLQLADLSDFHLYRSNPDIVKYQGFEVMNLKQAEEFIIKNAKKHFGKTGEWVQYAIVRKETGKLIGDCALKLDQNDRRIAAIGITISHREQRKAYAKEAMHLLLKFLFEEVKIHRVVETVDVENTASINLLRSLQFRQEGHFIENIFFKGKWRSEFQYAMLKREWEVSR